jgi:ATP-dependent DNA ligase I
VLLSEVAQVSREVAGTPARRAKIAAIAGVLRQAPPDEVPIAVAFLAGELRQRQIGVGYAALSGLAWPTGGPAGGPGPTPPPAPQASLTLTEVDAAFEAIGALTGSGSQGARRGQLAQLLSRATAPERDFLAALVAGELRQGALEGVMTEAVAQAAELPSAQIRRAHQVSGSLAAVAQAALTGDDPAAAVRGLGLQVGRPVRPMLAAAAPAIAAALERVSPAAVEWKIDGIRIQVHKFDGQVRVFTRTLDDITERVPEITEVTAGMAASSLVLDGEAVALGPGGRPRPFQVTSARVASQADVARQRGQTPVTPFFFDLLHLDGTDLIDAPGQERFRLLSGVVPGALLIPRIVTTEAETAQEFFADAVSRGHEGVVVKSLDAAYVAGRRGSEWIKVKPRHTLDLIILAAEWGHGRRRGWLSNLHLGARDPATGDLIMLGKTFKGLTDDMLGWQTSALLDLADPPRPALSADDRAGQYGTVRVRPELVVEIAFDGVQASRRYPGGLALRFARVLRHRPDKAAAEADTIESIREIWSAAAPADGD